MVTLGEHVNVLKITQQQLYTHFQFYKHCFHSLIRFFLIHVRCNEFHHAREKECIIYRNNLGMLTDLRNVLYITYYRQYKTKQITNNLAAYALCRWST